MVIGGDADPGVWFGFILGSLTGSLTSFVIAAFVLWPEIKKTLRMPEIVFNLKIRRRT